MIYFDNAATTLIKPKAVSTAVVSALKKCGNPSRGGHPASLRASETVFECRSHVAHLFGLPDMPERIVFTQNATYALNTAIKSILRNGGHAVISGYEHNSVVRPIEALKSKNVTYSIATAKPFDVEGMIKAFAESIRREKTDCVIVNHVSNVFGYELPIYEIDDICLKYGLPLIIDASQSAGSIKIEANSLKSAAYICMPGHKGLFGPQGTGILLCCKDIYLNSIVEGGTGSNSISFAQPDFLPDVFESGTPNIPGIAGLLEGIKFIEKNTVEEIEMYEYELLKRLKEELSSIAKIKLYSSAGHRHAVLSFSLGESDSETVCDMLGKEGICVRGGIHCSPLAHMSADTEKRGTVRVSLSVFNSFREIKKFAEKLNKIASSIY